MKKYIVIHCSDVGQNAVYDQFKSINEYHRDARGFPISSLGIYCGYHALITGGKNYQCRLDSDVGAHCNQGYDGKTVFPAGSGLALSMNFQSLGVCVGFSGDSETMSNTHYNLLQEQVWKWQDAYGISNDKVFFHRKFNTDKTCPGSLLNQAWLDKLLTRNVISIPAVLPTEPCTEEHDTIEAQKKQVGLLQSLVQSIISFFNKK